MPSPLVRIAVPAALALLAADAHAQLSAGVRVDSDYRYRGVSLSDRRPSVQLSLAYDTPAGWYSGLALSAVRLGLGPPADAPADAYPDDAAAGDGAGGLRRGAMAIAYGGRAQRMDDGATWEAGFTAAHFTADSRRDHGELYAGYASPPWGLRAYWSPAYFGFRLRTLYVEASAATTLGADVRAFGHVGLLARLSGTEGWGASRAVRADARVGIGWALGAWELQLARVAASARGPYPATGEGDRGAWVVSVVGRF